MDSCVTESCKVMELISSYVDKDNGVKLNNLISVFLEASTIKDDVIYCLATVLAYVDKAKPCYHAKSSTFSLITEPELKHFEPLKGLIFMNRASDLYIELPKYNFIHKTKV